MVPSPFSFGPLILNPFSTSELYPEVESLYSLTLTVALRRAISAAT
jgi:hypothetical protein